MLNNLGQAGYTLFKCHIKPCRQAFHTLQNYINGVLFSHTILHFISESNQCCFVCHYFRFNIISCGVTTDLLKSDNYYQKALVISRNE